MGKNLGISHHEALYLNSKKYGFSNYKHYLNALASSIPLMEITCTSEHPASQNIELEISLYDNSQLSFQEKLAILQSIRNPDDMQARCINWALMQDEIQTTLFDEFLTKKGKYEIQFREANFVAKAISISDLSYEIIDGLLCVNGEYDLNIKFDSEGFCLIEGSEVIEFGLDVPEQYKEYPHFKERSLSGPFGIKIGMNEKITILHLSIIQIIDGMIFAGTLKPTAKLFPAIEVKSVFNELDLIDRLTH